MSDTVSFIVRLPTKPEQRDRMRELLFDVLDNMAREPDFINTWVHEDLNDPDTLVLYETWACSREHFIAHHLAKPYRAQYEAALPDLLSAERSIDFLKMVRAYPNGLPA
jgi:quinol monooxygenase YgiN